MNGEPMNEFVERCVRQYGMDRRVAEISVLNLAEEGLLEVRDGIVFKTAKGQALYDAALAESAKYSVAN